MRLIGCVKCHQMVYMKAQLGDCEHVYGIWDCKSKVSGPCSPNINWSHGFLECGWEAHEPSWFEGVETR